MAQKICFASIDIEKDLGTGEFRGVENLDEILNIFKKYEIPATLFTTGEALQKYPDKFRKLAVSWEIACHSFTHRFWNTLNGKERQKELDDFINLYQQIFQKKPLGFRAPSHIIDGAGLALLKEKGFLYDSSVLPGYPFFITKYRGYQGRKPEYIHFIKGLQESPVTGALFGIPLVGTWFTKLPVWLYGFFIFFRPYITLNMHSWDALKPGFAEKLEKIIKLLKKKNYSFFNGEQLLQNR